MFSENTEMLPTVNSSDPDIGNYYPTEGTKLVLVGISTRNKLVWVEVVPHSE